MTLSILFTGDINLVTVTDPKSPFSRVTDIMKQADLRFGNLECCFYENANPDLMPADGFHAKVAAAGALPIAGFNVVGTANNGNFGSEAILHSNEKLDSMGTRRRS